MTLPQNRSALPDAWVAKIFTRMTGLYGVKFADAWRGCEEAARETWADALSGFSADEIAAGLRGCLGCDWPQTLPEFVKLCRPGIDYDAAYATAVEQMRLRERGQDRWPSAAIFWAAASLGSDLFAFRAEAIRGRWRIAVDAAIAEVAAGTRSATVPARSIALPPPPTLSRDEAERILAATAVRAGQSPGWGLGAPHPKAWAHEIRRRYLAGESLHSIQISNASEALGETWADGVCTPRIEAMPIPSAVDVPAANAPMGADQRMAA